MMKPAGIMIAEYDLEISLWKDLIDSYDEMGFKLPESDVAFFERLVDTRDHLATLDPEEPVSIHFRL